MRKTNAAGGTSRLHVDFGKSPNADLASAEYGHLSPVNVLGTFDYTLTPGMLTPISIACMRKQLIDDQLTPSGLWLVQADNGVANDEFGWICIHWPSYLRRVVWHRDTFGYLTAQGCSVKSLQKMRLQEFEDAQNVINSYKAVLLRTLPPGCLLEADNPFYGELFDILAKPPSPEDDLDSSYSANLRHWTVFRFGGLSKAISGHGSARSGNRANVFSSWLKPYAVVSDLLIRKAIENAPAGTPTLIMVLLTVLAKARYSDGKGWQKWGVAWTRKGLAFNYRQALNTLQEDPDLYNALLKGYTEEPCAEWIDPAYMLVAGPRGLPRLGEIAVSDCRGRAYIHGATMPYYNLFQDTDPSIPHRRHTHDTDFQILFPISPSTAATESILRYIEVLATYNNVKPGMAMPVALEKAAAELSTESRSFYAASNVKDVDPVEKKAPSAARDRSVYIASFDGYSLGCTLTAPTDVPVYPLGMATVEYLGDNYFTLPDTLAKALPELLETPFYARGVTKASLVWTQTAFNGYTYKVIAKKNASPSDYRSRHVAEITLSHFAMKRKQFSHTAEGVTYLHHSVFRPDGEFNAVADAILAHHPALNPDHADLLATFRTLWQWVFDIRSVIAQGKVTGELMYTVGLETTHCPPDKRLDTPTKRLQYIIDKASHSRDERVCDLLPSHDQSASRSKQMNTYDDFVMWYVAQHEIAELPWRLHPLQQAEYICKRWLPWRRPPGLVKHLITPHKKSVPYIDSAQMPQLLAYAQNTFGVAFTEY